MECRKSWNRRDQPGTAVYQAEPWEQEQPQLRLRSSAAACADLKSRTGKGRLVCGRHGNARPLSGCALHCAMKQRGTWRRTRLQGMYHHILLPGSDDDGIRDLSRHRDGKQEQLRRPSKLPAADAHEAPVVAVQQVVCGCEAGVAELVQCCLNELVSKSAMVGQQCSAQACVQCQKEWQPFSDNAYKLKRAEPL